MACHCSLADEDSQGHARRVRHCGDRIILLGRQNWRQVVNILPKSRNPTVWNSKMAKFKQPAVTFCLLVKIIRPRQCVSMSRQHHMRVIREVQSWPHSPSHSPLMALYNVTDVTSWFLFHAGRCQGVGAAFLSSQHRSDSTCPLSRRPPSLLSSLFSLSAENLPAENNLMYYILSVEFLSIRCAYIEAWEGKQAKGWAHRRRRPTPDEMSANQ